MSHTEADIKKDLYLLNIKPSDEVYDLILTVRTAYRLTTKRTFWVFSFVNMKKITKNTVCGLHKHTHSCKR